MFKAATVSNIGMAANPQGNNQFCQCPPQVVAAFAEGGQNAAATVIAGGAVTAAAAPVVTAGALSVAGFGAEGIVAGAS